jgi:sortase A
MRSLSLLPRVLVAIGCGCLTAFGIQMTQAASFQQAADQRLERALTAPAPAVDVADVDATDADQDATPPAEIDAGLVGRIEIPRLNMSAIVMEGDDDGTLARAVGHVPGTPLPWQSGNVVMAGHRDTFFRPLRDLRDGDDIELITTRGRFDYQVVGTEIVDPDDVSVLAPAPGRSLTLITCYPFTYIGRAPQRFIIHAR